MVKLRFRLGLAALPFIFLILPILAAKEDACRPMCRGSYRSNNFRYTQGSTYKYNFHSAVDISLANAKGQKSKTEVKATVLVTPQPQCNHLLALENVEIIGANSQKYRHIAGIEKTIQFHFEDGVIGDHICVETDETHNSLNIKRAITSLFQVDTTHEHETDVFGVCPTLGEIENKANGEILVTKIRDLNDCAFRESIKEDFMVSSFNPDSDFKSSPILDGDYMSQQIIKNGILHRGAVFENYTYLTFNNEDDEDKEDPGARIRVLTTLEYTGMTRVHQSQSRATEPKSIIFDNPHPITSDKSNMDLILRAVQEIMKDNDLTVGEHSARHFLNLIKILRDSTKDDILTVYRQVKAGAGFRNREKARKVFLDALFRCGTGNAIVVGVELLKNRELTPLEEKLVFLSFGFVKHATLSALEAASSLLDTNPGLPREAYLGIGNLAGRYCREHSCKAEAVQRLTERLAGKLRYGRVHSREEENEIIFVLKALANIQHLNENVISKVSSIVQDKVSPTRLRVAALETYMTDACHDSVKNSALNILKDIQEDSELRIKAYLVVSKCPDSHIAREIKTLLNKEPSYQVGGFIVSHLRNLQASANPDRKTAKEVLDGISTKKKFPIDPRKYSFNAEFSYDMDNIGVSNSIESNVIYSQNSFLPRSTSLNLTAELFGHTINFLEIGLRQQNLDRLMEHYFGPLGVFNKQTPDEVEKTGTEEVENIIRYFSRRLERVRSKRDVSKLEIDNFGRQVQIRTNELNNELDLDLSIKLFGSELFFLSISDDTENLSPEDIIDRFFDNYEKDLAKARNFNENIQENYLFIDSQLSYPTSLGFPLRLGIEGTAAIQVKAQGNMDITRLLNNNANSGIFKLSIIPSANIEVATSITLDAQVVEGGLKLISNLYTATGGDLEIDLQDRNRGVEVKFSLPLQKQKVISATHEAVFKTRELGKSEEIQPLKFGQNRDFSVCVNDLAPYLGLNYCMDLTAPADAENGYLAGNYKFALGIDNEDFSHFHYKEAFTNDHYRGIGGELTAEVVGSRQNKKMSLKLEAFYGRDSFVKASLVSPMKTASIEGRATNTDTEKSLSYEIQLDNQKAGGKLGLSVSGPPQRQKFTPILEYSISGAYGHERLPIQVQGAFVIEQRGRRGDYKVTFENLQLTIEESGKRPHVYSINGNMGHEMHEYYSDLNLSDEMSTYGIHGKLNIQRNLIKLDGQLTDSRNSDSNLHVIYAFKRHPTEIDSVLQLIHGRDPNSQQNKITISNSLIQKRINNYDSEIRSKNIISYPLIYLDAVIEFAQAPNSIFYDTEIKYEKYIIGSELDLKYSRQTEGDYNLNFELYDDNDEITLKATREISGDKNTIHNTLVINNQKYELSGTVTIRDHPNDVTYSADLNYMAPQLREPLRIHEEYVNNHNRYNAIVKITDSREEYIDFTGSLTPDNSNMKLKVTLRDLVLINGHATESRGNGNGEITIEYVPERQVIKADATYTIHEPTYNMRLTVYPDFHRNRGNYMTITTNNQISENSMDSKNTIEVSGQKLQLNAAYSEEERESNGKTSSALDITMPNGYYGGVKYNYNYNLRDDYLNSQEMLDIEARGIFGLRNGKISLKEILKDVNLDEDVYDYAYSLAADNGNGDKIHVEAREKRQQQEEQINDEAEIKIYKNYEDDGLMVSGKSMTKEDAETYDLSVTYDKRRYLLDMHGAYDISKTFEPGTAEIKIVLESPNPDLQNMKLVVSGSLDEVDDGYIELKSNGEFILNERSRSKNSININAVADIKIGADDGKLKAVINNVPGDPITITMDYNHDETDEIEKFVANAAIHYERYKNVKSDLTVENIKNNNYNIKYNMESPNSPPIRVDVTVKELKEGIEYSGHATIIANYERYEITELVNLSDDTPKYTLEIKFPNGDTDEYHFSADLSKSNQIEGDIKVKIHGNVFELESSLDARYHSKEDFLIKLSANCPKLEVHDFSLEIRNTPISSGGYMAPSNLMATTSSPRNYNRGYERTPQNYQDRDQRYEQRQRYRRQTYRNPQNRNQMYGEQLYINAQHAGRNLLSGKASYQIQDHPDRTVIEGSGTFTIRDESPRQHSYKIVCQKVYASRDRGEGIEYTLNIQADNDVVDAKLMYTDREFEFLTTVCESSSRSAVPCLRIQADSKMYFQSITDFEIVETAKLDLRYLGWHEMGVKEILKNRGDVFESSGEIILDNRNKYQYRIYGDERTFESSISTPSRVISLEGKVETPWRGRAGPTNVQVDLYMNKNQQPHQKTSLIALYDCNEGRQVGRCNIELKLTDPTLRKDLTVTWTSSYDERNLKGEQSLVLDIFNNVNDKIVATGKYSAKRLGREGLSANLLCEVKSQGLNVDIKYEENLSFDPSYARELKYDHLLKIQIGRANYNNIATLHIIPQQISIKAKLLNQDVLDINCKYQGNDYNRIVDTTVRMIGVPPSVSHLEITNNRVLKLTIAHVDRPNDKFQIVANLFYGGVTDLKAEYYEWGRPMHLLAVSLRMDNRGDLVYDYIYDERNIEKYVIIPARNEYLRFKQELETLEQNAERDLANQASVVDEIAKWSVADFRPMEQYYKGELEKFERELKNDRVLQDVIHVFDEIIRPLQKWILEMLTRIDEINRSTEEAILAQYDKLYRQLEREINPWIKQIAKETSNNIKTSWDVALEVSNNIMYEINKFVGEHKKEIKEIGVFIVEALEDVIVFAINLAETIEKEVREHLEKLNNEIRATVILEDLEKRLQEAFSNKPVPEEYIQNFKDVMNNIKDSADSPEIKKLITLLTNYIEQKLRRQEVDDVAATQNILAALYDILSLIYDAYITDTEEGVSVSMDMLYAIPKLIAIELSPVTYLLQGDWPDLEELLDSASLDTDDWTLPEDLNAIIANGQHIFTFDENYMTFPGTCDYLLAHDAINGNFSIVGSYTNGLLSSITFVDKLDSVTIKQGGHVLLNRASTELPIHKQHRLEVYQDYETIRISSKSGVDIICGLKLMVCAIRVSGYYHAQLRGLLGNGNNEPYDDFTLPTGIIVANVGEFGNAYSMGGRCPVVRTPDHTMRQRNPTCTRLFGSNSPLRTCYSFVDPSNYRTACDHGMANNIKNTDLAVAFAYVGMCTTKGLPMMIPNNFAKCTNYEKPVKLDESFQVTTPGRAADIVIIVDQDKANEQVFRAMLQPLVSQLTSTLSSEGITDVDFHIIGYGGAYEKHPYHYTVDGKLTFKGGRIPNVHFSTPLKESKRETFMEYVTRITEEVELLTGQDMLSEAYYEALMYPFRAHAVKSIIVFNSKPCSEAHLEQLQSWSSYILVDEQYTVNLFTPFKGINPRDRRVNNVVGFNHDSVFTFSNPAGSKEGHEIESDNFCVEFALKNRGNVFVTNNYQGRNEMEFVRVATQNIVKELTSMEQWLDCKCEMVTSYTAQNVCSVSYSRKRQLQKGRGRYQ